MAGEDPACVVQVLGIAQEYSAGDRLAEYRMNVRIDEAGSDGCRPVVDHLGVRS